MDINMSYASRKSIGRDLSTIALNVERFSGSAVVEIVDPVKTSKM